MPETDPRCPRCGAPLGSNELGHHCGRCLAHELLAPDSAAIENADDVVLHRLGDYELLEEIGRGGMGVVFRARQVSLDRVVAVKLPRDGWLTSPEERTRFRAEAASAARLRHPNIVAVHEIGEDQGQLYFAMDWVDGESLAAFSHEGQMTWRRAARIVSATADALQHAHARGVLHRDLKPSNILLDAHDQPQITDFGLARPLDAASTLTMTGQILGTPGYLAPEQASGVGPVGMAVDVYGLGAVLYHLLTGRPPVAGANALETLRSVAEQEPTSPALLNPSVPRDLSVVCLKCLAKVPADRYPSAHALRDDLERVLAGRPVRARPVSPWGRLVRWTRREPVVAASLGLTIGVLASALLVTTREWRSAESAQKREALERRRAESALAALQLRRAELLREEGDFRGALLSFAKTIRTNPRHPVAGARLLSFLTYRDLAVPLADPIHPSGVVNWVRPSPEGQRVVTASYDGSAQVWDLLTGRGLSPPMKHPQRVRYAEFSPDGERIVTASGDRTVRVWNARTGEALTDPLRHGEFVNTAHFSPDGRKVASGADDHIARVWDARTGQLLWASPEQRGNVVESLFGPDGTWMMTTARCPEGARIWDAETGALLQTLPTPVTGCRSGAIRPDGRTLALGTYHGSVLLLDRESGETRATLELKGVLGFVQCLDFSRDGTRLLAVGGLNVWIWDLADLQRPPQIVPMAQQISSACFGESSTRVLVSSLGVALRVFDVQRGRIGPRQQAFTDAITADFGPRGDTILAASRGTTALTWPLADPQAAATLREHPAGCRFARTAPNGLSILASVHLSRALAYLWEAPTNLWSTTSLPDPDLGRVEFMEWSADGSLVATVHRGREVLVRERRSGHPTANPFVHDSPVQSLCFSPIDDLLATTCEDGSVHLWKVRNGAPVFPPRWHQKIAFAAGFSADGRELLTRSQDGTARLWEVSADGTLRATFVHEGAVLSAELSPDGSQVLTGSHDGTARLWSRATGALIEEPMRHRNMVEAARFSPDGHWIVTASADGTARLWDAATTLPISEPLRHGGVVSDAHFSPDGRRVVTTSTDDQVRVWPVSSTTATAPQALPALAEFLAGETELAGTSLAEGLHQRVQAMLRETADEPDNPYGQWIREFAATRLDSPTGSPPATLPPALTESTHGPTERGAKAPGSRAVRLREADSAGPEPAP